MDPIVFMFETGFKLMLRAGKAALSDPKQAETFKRFLLMIRDEITALYPEGR